MSVSQRKHYGGYIANITIIIMLLVWSTLTCHFEILVKRVVGTEQHAQTHHVISE